MPVRRRELIVAGLAVPVLGAATLVLGRSPRGGHGSGPNYHSSLVKGLTPDKVEWDGRKWSADMGSTWNQGMDHSFQFTDDKARFEIQPNPRDRGENDDPHKRRSELHATKDLLPNGVPLWGAMSFNHHSWSDRAGMAQQAQGGVHGQVHMHKFRGSPALAFRRRGDGSFLITTRGENDGDGSKRWTGQVAFDRIHDLVYRLLLHPTDGALDVWLDGAQIVSLKNVSIGSSLGGCYWCIGCYYGGGVTCPVVAEFANHVFFDPQPLSSRIGSPPAWPAA